MAQRAKRDPLKTMQKRLSEGRGKGHGPDYQPYLKVRDVPSKGFSSREKGWKTGRIHHMLSNLELNYFYSLEWKQSVVDIREQYPLPLESTMEIAERLHIRHPTDPGSKKPAVMTTDFFVDIAVAEGVISVARSVKPSKTLSSKRVIEKLELERRFWFEHDIDWGLVTEREIPDILARNVEIIHTTRNPKLNPGFSKQLISMVEQNLLEQNCRFMCSFAESARRTDQRLGLEEGTSLWIAQHLIANKVWSVDMSIPLNFSQFLCIARNEREYGVWATAA